MNEANGAVTTADTALIAAAKFERDRRADSYPGVIAQRRAQAVRGTAEDTPLIAGMIDGLTADYQAWCAIAAWLETGRFSIFEGGTDGGTLIDWEFAERAAEKALAKLSEGGSGGAPPSEARARRDRVSSIHAMIARQRRLIDGINAGFRQPLGRQPVAA